jgi:hypothetical protein
VDPLPRSRRRSPHTVSVAELLCRYDTAPAVPLPRTPSDPAEPVPVSALLRREGRARRALDRPLVPRGHSRPVPAPVEAPLHGTRKASAAAGALFVVGAVFGAGVLEEALLRPNTEAEAADRGAGSGSAGIGTGADGERGAGSAVTLASATEALSNEPLSTADLLPVTGADIGAAALLPAAGSAVPGPVTPAAVGAGPALPGAAVPGAPAPGAAVPGAPAPGAAAPGAPAPGAAAPGTPAPGAPAPGADPGAAPGAEPGAAPGAEAPDPGPAGPAPVGPGPAGPGAGPADPGPVPVPVEVPVDVPDLGTPPVEVPGIALPPTPLGPVGTPSITLTEAVAVTPDLTVALDEDGLAVGGTDTVVVSPDAALGALDAGPVGLTGTDATVGDLRIEGAELLRVGPEPEVTVPAATLTPTSLETPDLRLGDTVMDVPDLALPELSTPEVPVVETVTGLLGVSGGGDTETGGGAKSVEEGSDDGGTDDGADRGSGDEGSGEEGSPLALVEDVPLVGGLLG